jgi:hypothetical protein
MLGRHNHEDRLDQARDRLRAATAPADPPAAAHPGRPAADPGCTCIRCVAGRLADAAHRLDALSTHLQQADPCRCRQAGESTEDCPWRCPALTLHGEQYRQLEA